MEGAPSEAAATTSALLASLFTGAPVGLVCTVPKPRLSTAWAGVAVLDLVRLVTTKGAGTTRS